MSSPNLGTKRVCPKCGAKFYDFGAVAPITCPKCAHSWKESARKKEDKPKKEAKPLVKPVRKSLLAEDALGDDIGLPGEDDAGESVDIEPLDDDSVEMTSLEEVEEHEDEDDDIDPNSDDASDDMFTEMVGGEKLVDDLEDHMEDEEDDEDAESDEDDDEDEDDDTPKKRRR